MRFPRRIEGLLSGLVGACVMGGAVGCSSSSEPPPNPEIPAAAKEAPKPGENPFANPYNEPEAKKAKGKTGGS
mgnify:CR=1 FL=1